VSLYWLTDTFPHCIYDYRGYFSGEAPPEFPFMSKAFGFSRFAKDPKALRVVAQCATVLQCLAEHWWLRRWDEFIRSAMVRESDLQSIESDD